MPLGAATVVQVLHGVFYVLLQLLGIAAITVSFVASFIVVVIPPLQDTQLVLLALVVHRNSVQVCRSQKSYLQQSDVVQQRQQYKDLLQYNIQLSVKFVVAL